ncbi:MAG: translocation/assembly module TamB domain-containing protein, partial [Nannocystaceae bacterium]
SLLSTGTSVAGVRLGRVGLQARLRERSVSSTLDVVGSGLGRWTLRSTIPVQLGSERQALLVDEPLSADLRVQQLDLAALRPVLPPELTLAGMIDLDVGLRGRLRSPTLRARLQGHALALDGRPLGELSIDAGHRRGRASVTARLEHPQITGLQVEAEVPVDVDLPAGAVRWRPDRPHAAHVHVDDVDLRLAQTWAELPLSGHVDLDARLGDTMRSPTLGVTVHWREVGYQNRILASGGLELRYEHEQVSLRAEASGPAFEGLGLVAAVPVGVDVARGGATWRASDPHSIDVSLAGLRLQRAASLLDPAPDVEGRVSAQLRVRGNAARPLVHATVSGDRLAYGGRTVGQLELEADYRERRVDTRLDWQQDTRRSVQLTASIPLDVDTKAGRVDWRRNAAHRVTLAVPRLDPTLLAPFVELPEDLDFAVALHGIGEGTPEAFELSASARGYGGLGQLPRQPVDLHVSADPNQQRLSLRIGPVGPGVALDAQAQAPVAQLISGAAVPDEVRVSGRLSAPTLPLSMLEVLLPEDLYDVRGTASIEASAEGTVARPALAGQVKILDASAVVVPLRQRIEGLQLAVSLEDRRVVLRELSLRGGRGSARARGQAQLEPDGSVQANATLVADRLPVRRPGLPFLEISTEVSTTARIDPTHTAVSVELRDSQVDVISTNVAEAKPIPESSTVRYVADLDAQTPAWSGRARGGPQGPPSTSAFELTLVDPLRIRGPAVDMSWTGTLHADGRGDRLSARGSLEARDGFFELIDNRFVIERGKVTIPESSELRLFADIAAAAQVDDVEVTATIRGALPRPELTLTSTPSLTDSQIFALLLTGNANFDAADPDQVEAQAAALLTAFTSPALQRQLNDRLRVDRIGLGVGESTNQPILSVGKNLSRKVYAETQYHHNAPERQNRAELRVRYRFAPRWSLETFVGDAAVAGLDVFWSKAFDGPPRKEPTAPTEP